MILLHVFPRDLFIAVHAGHMFPSLICFVFLLNVIITLLYQSRSLSLAFCFIKVSLSNQYRIMLSRKCWLEHGQPTRKREQNISLVIGSDRGP